MVLHVDSDAAYLVVDGAWSRIAGRYYLSSDPIPKPGIPTPAHNDPSHTLCRILKTIVASAAEAETVGFF